MCLGLMDEEILDVVFTCTVRNCFSKMLDAFNARFDKLYLEFESELVKVLTVGNPFQLQLKRMMCHLDIDRTQA